MGITWEEVKKKLEERYVGELTAVEAMRSLVEIMQEGESLADLIERVSKLALLAFLKAQMRVNAVVQIQFVDCFVDALNNEEVKRDVLRLSLKTVAEAVSAARTSEGQLERLKKRKQKDLEWWK